MNIHATAIVSAKAQLNKDIEIGPYVIIEDNVRIGRGVKIYPHAQVLNQTSIGDDCQIHMGAVLGHLPQIRQKTNQSGRLIVGHRNIFREYVTVHRSSQLDAATVIGDDNYFMGFSHIAHDCSIGNRVTVCNGTLVAGHAVIGDYAFISGNVTVHQFCRIGTLAMVGGLSRVAKDVPPYMLIKGDSVVWAVNSVGLRRANLSNTIRVDIKKAFKLLYKSGLNVRQAVKQLQGQRNSAEVEHLISFILQSQRGICRQKNPTLWKKIGSSNLILSWRGIPAYDIFKISNRRIKWSK